MPVVESRGFTPVVEIELGLYAPTMIFIIIRSFLITCINFHLETQCYIFNRVSNAIYFFNIMECNLGRNSRSQPSSCEFFPIESCSSLKDCTSRLVLAANEVRSHSGSKVFTFVLLRCFLHISSPILWRQVASKLSALHCNLSHD